MTRPLALVTGASAGIGRALLPLFAKDGNDLVVVARRSDKLDELRRDLEARFSTSVVPIALDLAEEGAAHRLFEETERRGLVVDTLVNNAGIGMYGLFVDQPLAQLERMVRLNISALTSLTHLYLAGMRARGRGRILQVASTAAYQPGPRMAAYYASKAYVLSLSEALHVELAGDPRTRAITITTLCPGPTRSEFNDVAGFKVTPLVESQLMTSEEVAEIGYRALLAGERTAIAGTKNKALAMVSQVSPRGLVLAVTERLMRSRE